MAAGADTIVVVVGYTPGDEGEEYAINAAIEAPSACHQVNPNS